MDAPTMQPPALSRLDAFVARLTLPEVRRVLEADPLGVNLLATPNPSEAAMRELCFETLRSRPTFWGNVRATLAAEKRDTRRQLTFRLGESR